MLAVAVPCSPSNHHARYGEGSSNNKFVEIYNPTSSAVALGDYAWLTCFNGCSGSTYESWNSFSSGDTVAVNTLPTRMSTLCATPAAAARFPPRPTN